MKRLLFPYIAATLAVLTAAAAFGGLPQTINHQGYLTGSNGAPVSGSVSMVFSLYSSNPARNNPVWRETQGAVALNSGIYSTRLGSVKPITVPFDAPYYLGVKVGSDPEMALQSLSSNGYAFRAGIADTVAAGSQTVKTSSAGSSALIVKGATGQSADLQQWQDVSGATVASVSATGLFTGDGTGLTGIQKKYGKIAVVAKYGGDYTDPVAAMNDLAAWCGTPSAANTCKLTIMPGVYSIAPQLAMQPYVDISGSGVNTTILVRNSGSPNGDFYGVVRGASNCELRDLAISSRFVTGYAATGIDVSSVDTMKLSNLSIVVDGSGSMTVGINSSLSTLFLANVDINSSSTGASTPVLGILGSFSRLTMLDSTVYASGGSGASGFYTQNTWFAFNGVKITAAHSSAISHGLYLNDTTSLADRRTIDNSRIEGGTHSIYTLADYMFEVRSSALVGPTNSNNVILVNTEINNSAQFSNITLGASSNYTTISGVTTGIAQHGVYGLSSNSSGHGVYGKNSSSNAYGFLGGRTGVYGSSPDINYNGVYGENSASSAYGYLGGYHGVAGFNPADGQAGVYGQSSHVTGYGVLGNNTNTSAKGLLGAGTTGVVGYAGSAAGSYAGYFYGNVYSTGTYNGSDRRLKTDIQPLENSLAKVLNLHGVSYLLKTDEAGGRKIGVIAQELEQEYPELVNTDDKGMKSVAYANLTAVLIEAVKGLKNENDELKIRLERLEQLFGVK